MVEHTPAQGPERPTAVYWLYAQSLRLLYVGVSNHPVQRFIEHRDTKDWWPEVATYSIMWFDTRAAAESFEILAIKNDGPLHNIAMQPRDHPASRTFLPAWKADDLLTVLIELVLHLTPNADGDQGHEVIRSTWQELNRIFDIADFYAPVERHPLDLDALTKAIEAFGPLLPTAIAEPQPEAQPPVLEPQMPPPLFKAPADGAL